KGLKGLISLIHPNLVFLSETKCTVAEMVEIKVQLGWRNAFAVPCKFKQKKNGKGDIVFHGSCFTWRGKRGGEEIRIRLDRFLASRSWIDLFPVSRVVHQLPNKSDHLPIVLEARVCRPRKKQKKKKKLFRFEELWLRDEECSQMVELGWSHDRGTDPFTIVCNKIKQTRLLLIEWSDTKFGALRRDIVDIREKLSLFYDSSLSSPPEEIRVDLETKLNVLLKQEQDFWRQRSKVFWLSDGDFNTRFFHQRASNRRKKNRIKGLFNENGLWCTDDGEIESIILKYFQTLFTTSHPRGMDVVASLLPPCISDDINALLTCDVTENEIFKALKQMHPAKAPGPDGFAPCFYQHFWPLVGGDVTRAVRCFLESDDMMKQVNGTNVTLIPKVKDLESISQLRPISLCNVLYKLGSKVLANRIKPILNGIISPFQSAFVPGRLISDNSLTAFEIAHFLKNRRRGHVGFGALKLDMSKAYDRVEWNFLKAVLLQLGFSPIWVTWVMRCITTVSYSFVINGTPRGRIVPSRGLRQGAPPISHLFFADDSFIFFKAEMEECLVLKNIFKQYEEASGQCINYQKSSVAFSKNVDRATQDVLAASLDVERVDKHDKYLGLPVEISYSKSEAFDYLTERVRKRTRGWREKMLSAAGKEVMIKAVTQSIPTYVMSCFELPQHLCQEMHSLMAKFWWGDKLNDRKIHWLAWEKLCVPKTEGGLGFRNMVLFNQALLAKQGWRIIQNPTSLIASLYKAKYFPDCSFLDAGLVGGASYAWRSIMHGRELLKKGLRFQVGNGSNISVWSDPWMPLPFSFKPFTRPPDGLENLQVADLIDSDLHEWDFAVLQELFSPSEIEIIGRIPLSMSGPEDRLTWYYDKKGCYSVRSGYHVARNEVDRVSRASTSNGSFGVNSQLWRKLWHARTPPKVRSFMWRVLKGILPTKVALARRVTLPNMKCVLCNSSIEDGIHLFKDCDIAGGIWLVSNLGVHVKNVLGRQLEDWVLNVMELLHGGQFELFCMLLWVIWTERNNVLWKGTCFNASSAAQWASKFLEDFHKHHPVGQQKNPRIRSKWELPPRGRLKINVDGSYRSESGDGGVVIVVRDEFGTCIAAMARYFPHVLSATHMEAEACRAGLLLAIHQYWGAIDLESDCSLVVAA
ncbi:hypothetical protein ABKV19_002583, partial [Rosa sericea]